jgi:hypothetical protein
VRKTEHDRLRVRDQWPDEQRRHLRLPKAVRETLAETPASHGGGSAERENVFDADCCSAPSVAEVETFLEAKGNRSTGAPMSGSRSLRKKAKSTGAVTHKNYISK